MFNKIRLFITPSPIIIKSHKFYLTCVFLLNSIKLLTFKYKYKMICEENRMNKESRLFIQPFFLYRLHKHLIKYCGELITREYIVCLLLCWTEISSLQLSKWIPTVPSFFALLGIPTISSYFEEKTTFRELYSCSDRLLLEEVYCLKVERFWLR